MRQAASASKNGAARATQKIEPMATSAGEDSDSGDLSRASYFGGKGSCFRHLVNQIPPHDWLIVPFAGHCAIVRKMQLPNQVWVNDLDVEVFRWWGLYLEAQTRKEGPEYSDRFGRISNQCGIKLLESLQHKSIDRSTFVYLDPPYLLETRKSGPRYRCEATSADHLRILRAARQLDCNVMISGYWSDLYSTELTYWRHYSFESQTRRGTATESVWCNYPQPKVLQDYRWLGRNKRERFKLLRRERNLIDKLRRLPELERNALLASVDSNFGCDRSTQ